MKKILITIIGFILLILIIVSAIKGIKIGKLAVYSFEDIKQQGQELDTKIEEVNTEKNQNYAKALSDNSKSTNNLKQIKEEYEAKVATLSENPELGLTQIEKYKIEYLWNTIGSYARKEGLKIDLNIEETTIQETYNIKFSLQGSYVGITDFLYDIENDDELNYKVKDFKIDPTTSTDTTTSGKTVSAVNTDVLYASFVVENVIINFS